MQKLYTNNYRRPSLRFLQRDVDRKKEHTTGRQSARVSKAFAMRNLQLPKETFVTEESAESASGRYVQVPLIELEANAQAPPNNPESVLLPNQKAGPNLLDKANVRRKAFVDLQKEKLQRWKLEQQRKKDLARGKKKPFKYAVHLVHEMPKFLAGDGHLEKVKNMASKIPKATSSAPTRTFSLRSRSQQSENCPAPPSAIPFWLPRMNTGKENKRTQGKKLGTGKQTAPLMSSNLEKTVPRDLFSADVSRIELVAEQVSFAPENFKFTGVAHLTRAVEAARRSSTPIKVVGPSTSRSGPSSKLDLRRSRRLQAKSKEPAPVSGAAAASTTDKTYIIPQMAKPDTRPSNRVSMLPMVEESTVGCASEDNLINFSDV